MKTISKISKESLKSKIDRHEPVQIVNVLSSDYYHLGMIKGSIKMPLAELDQRSHELDKSLEVVTYCANTNCDASRKAAEKLADMGFDVKAYEGGIEEWTKYKFPTE